MFYTPFLFTSLSNRINAYLYLLLATIGVWKGTRNLANPDAPRWTWTALLNGLPEAAVQDLALFSEST